jgi:hypothetical protein
MTLVTIISVGLLNFCPSEGNPYLTFQSLLDA